jgi:hypothetical protein
MNFNIYNQYNDVLFSYGSPRATSYRKGHFASLETLRRGHV